MEHAGVGLGDADHGRIDDEVEMRGEPGLLEGEANRAVRVRDHARRETGRANALQSVDRFGVCPVTEPDGQVEGPPPLGHGALLAGVGDPQRLQQIAHVAPAAGPGASGLCGLLVIEADPRAGARPRSPPPG